MFETELISNTTTEEYGCSGGAVDRSSLGPFGLLVIADESLTELTPVYFRPVNTSDHGLKTYFCADETRFFFETSLFVCAISSEFVQCSTGFINVV